MKLIAEDRLEIQELLHRDRFVLDAGEHHGNGLEYADLYTEDGTFGTRPPGREWQNLTMQHLTGGESATTSSEPPRAVR